MERTVIPFFLFAETKDEMAIFAGFDPRALGIPNIEGHADLLRETFTTGTLRPGVIFVQAVLLNLLSTSSVSGPTATPGGPSRCSGLFGPQAKRPYPDGTAN